MKKKIYAVILIIALCLLCLPAFSGCKAQREYILKTDGEGDEYYSVKCAGFTSSFKGDLVIPESYNGVPVKEIEQEGFSGTNITSVTIPASVEIIGDAAFAHCYQLKKVTFGGDLTEIPRGMFGFCQSLRALEIPETVEKIGVAAFMHCEKLNGINLPDRLARIEDEAFEYCYSLTDVTLPDALAYIGERAFYNAGLKSIVIPDGVADVLTADEDGKIVTERALGYGAFHTCLSLESATVGSGITVLPAGTFGACSALKEVKISASLKAVEGAAYKDGKLYSGHAFFGCSALENVYFTGTAEQWNALKNNVDNKSVKENNVTYNNSALLNAAVHYV